MPRSLGSHESSPFWRRARVLTVDLRDSMGDQACLTVPSDLGLVLMICTSRKCDCAPSASALQGGQPDRERSERFGIAISVMNGGSDECVMVHER